MFEKKIKKFFNSVSICGERPVHKVKVDRRLLIIAGAAAGTVCAALGAGLAIYFMDKNAKSEPAMG